MDFSKFIPWSKRKGKEIEIPKASPPAKIRSPEFYHPLLRKWDKDINDLIKILSQGEAVIGRPWSFLYPRLSVLREMYSAFEDGWREYTNLIKYSMPVNLEREADLADQFNIPHKALTQFPSYRQRQKNRIMRVHTAGCQIADTFRANAQTNPLPEYAGIDQYRAQCYDECLAEIKVIINSL